MRVILIAALLSLGCAALQTNKAAEARRADLCNEANEDNGMQILLWGKSTPERVLVRRDLWETLPTKRAFLEWVALCALPASSITVYIASVDEVKDENGKVTREAQPEELIGTFSLCNRGRIH